MHGVDCTCCASTVSQGLDEVAFAASACSAAQTGDLTALERIISRARNPQSVLRDDGYGGEEEACFKVV